jgi:AcrR family transcriptional regulator
MSDSGKDEEVKNSIIEAAKRVFQKWGLSKTTMEDIAHEAGKGKSTLYYYYKSKEEIFKALAMSEINSMISRAKSSISGVSSPKEKLKMYFSTILNEMKKTVSIYPLVKGEIKGNTEFLENIRNLLDYKEESIIREILLQGLELGEFNFLSAAKIDKAANVIVGVIRGLELYLFLDNEDIEKIEIVTRLIAEGI